MTLARIQQQFTDSAQTKLALAAMAAPIETAGAPWSPACKAGGKVMACGNGGSAADSQHFAAELLNRFEKERPPLAGIALTTDTSTLTSIANDYRYEDVFAKQVRALAQPATCCWRSRPAAIRPTSSRPSTQAHARATAVVALTGKGAARSARCSPTTTSTSACRRPHRAHPGSASAHLHCLCDGIDA
jgi:D-sedoheptulose 7-phosphate isomerase